MKQIFILLVIFATSACNSNNNGLNKCNVEYHGELKRMMHKGDISAKAELKDFENSPHLYALGALENLKGEVLIMDGKPYNTTVLGDSMIFDHTFNKKTTLLVYATVAKWKSIPVPNNINTYDELEKFVGEAATDNLIRNDKPFPFLLEGMPRSFDWHVINWKDGDTEHSHEKHINSGLHGTLKNKQAEMLGFYSDSHHAIFTHHTTNMHIHVRSLDGSMAGHVDDLTLAKGMILKLPLFTSKVGD